MDEVWEARYKSSLARRKLQNQTRITNTGNGMVRKYTAVGSGSFKSDKNSRTTPAMNTIILPVRIAALHATCQSGARR
jgi:hypothetical protein